MNVYRPYALSPDPAVETRPWLNKRTGETIDVPLGIDPGWGYNVGEASRRAQGLRKLGESLRSTPADLGAAASPFGPGSAELRALVQEHEAWVADVTATDPESGALRHRLTGERRVVGALSPRVVEDLARHGRTPASAALTISDEEVWHLIRDAKQQRGQALPEAVIRTLPDYLARPTAVLWDEDDPALVYVLTVPGQDRRGKVVIRIDFPTKTRVDGIRRPVRVNTVRSGGLVPVENLPASRYRRIEGNL